ncbi:MAG: ParB/RepB/Spo0J family partition protein [Desulfobacterales bacterium]|nr:ParB/RepB/Spo0J family partition protein [Desulfobacterales bacterium]
MFKFKRILLSDIDFNDHSFLITTRSDIDDLMTSIRALGLLNFPLLIQKNSKYTVVCGFRRLAACQALGWPDMEARLLSSESPPLKCAQHAILDNISQRSLNYLEKSRSLCLLAACCGSLQELSQRASETGLPEHPDVIKKIMGLIFLPAALQTALLSDTISFPMALELGAMTAGEGVRLAELFKVLKLGFSMQSELIRHIKEISVREDLPIGQLLQERFIQNVLNDDDMDSIQKTRQIRSWLKQRRFPNLSGAEKEFESLAKSLKPGKHIKLTPPPDFEGLAYTLSFYFKNMKELLDCKDRFDKMICNPNLHRLLSRK